MLFSLMSPFFPAGPVLPSHVRHDISISDHILQKNSLLHGHPPPATARIIAAQRSAMPATDTLSE
jgi:hypothetical protein